VFLHAFPLNGRMFEPQMAAFSADRRVIAPDFPGFGRSPRTPAQPDVRYYAEGVRNLLDRLGLSAWSSAASRWAATSPSSA
jgi:pimeloyl-ACP methyl ester carboxylesterase